MELVIDRVEKITKVRMPQAEVGMGGFWCTRKGREEIL